MIRLGLCCVFREEPITIEVEAKAKELAVKNFDNTLLMIET